MINNLDVEFSEKNALIFTAYLPAWKGNTDQFWTLLSRQERVRAEKFITRGLQEAYILSHGLLRQILSYYSAIPPQNIQYAFNEFGKPFLMGYPRIQFNMSHSKDKVAYVIALDRQVGIDIEWKGRAIDISNTSDLVLTPAEVSRFNKLNLEERLHSFYGVWTKKEAIIKAIGQGLSYPIKKIEVLKSSLTEETSYNINNNTFYCFILPFLDNYAGAVAIDHKIDLVIHLDIISGKKPFCRRFLEKRNDHIKD